MGIIDYFLISFCASIDTFAVTLCKGVSEPKPKYAGIICAVWLSTFQVIMLLAGYFICNLFNEYVEAFDHWIAFGLFFILGTVTIKESFSSKEDTKKGLKIKVMFPLALASSIDSLMVGITSSLLYSNIYILCLMIIVFTSIFAFLGIYIGHKCGIKYKKIASILSGCLLILLGIKILIEHLFL